ncbi:hypothetical protein A0256_17585 [Mucilaginibacter sp. PAMC 26640]|nr:hypothetical protein A0256_17585 [Mucilaginibacter sp. PAMC 26640]
MLGQTEIPINVGKLKFIGRKNPLNVSFPDSIYFVKDLPFLNKDLEIYNYDGVYIFVADNSAKSLLNIFFTVRRLEY